MKKFMIDTAVQQCHEWASCLLDLWGGASILVVLAFIVYREWQRYTALRNSPAKQFQPGVGLTEFLRQQKNLEAVVAEVEIDLKHYDDSPATVRVRVKVYAQKEVQ